MTPRTVRCLAFIILVSGLLTVGSAAVAGASDEYNVHSEERIEVPDRTVSFGGQDFVITSVGRVEPTDTISATTTAPANEEYTLQFRNADGQQESFSEMTGDNSTLFSTNQLDPGTYALLVRANREYKALHPVIVSAYESDVNIDGELTSGKDFTTDIQLKEREDAPPIDSVRVGRVEDGELVNEIEASKQDGKYTAEMTAPSEERKFRVVTTVLGEEELAGTSEPEILEINEHVVTSGVFDVAIEDESTTEITEGETVNIKTTVKNTGGYTANKSVSFEYNGETIDTATLKLNGSESDSITFEYTPELGNTDQLSFSIVSENDSETINIDVVEESESTNTDENRNSIQNETTEQNSSEVLNDTNTSSRTENVTNSSTTVENKTNISIEQGNENVSEDSRTDTDSSSGSENDTIEPVSEEDDGTTSDETPLIGFPQFIAALLILSLTARESRRLQ